jgi:hypothetical protein
MSNQGNRSREASPPAPDSGAPAGRPRGEWRPGGAGSAIGREDSAPQFDAPVPRPCYTLFPMPKCRTLTSRAGGDG